MSWVGPGGANCLSQGEAAVTDQILGESLVSAGVVGALLVCIFQEEVAEMQRQIMGPCFSASLSESLLPTQFAIWCRCTVV